MLDATMASRHQWTLLAFDLPGSPNAHSAAAAARRRMGWHGVRGGAVRGVVCSRCVGWLSTCSCRNTPGSCKLYTVRAHDHTWLI